MARKYQGSVSSGHTILVIDDSPEILASTQQLLEADGHRVITAADGHSGIAKAQHEHPHLILVDYFMPQITGKEVVRSVRETNRLVQIILATGYSGEKPARVMMRELDIQGYHDKSEGAERLLLWVDSALKAYRHSLAMEKHRIGLQYILDVTPDLHRLQPLDELLQGLLWQVEGLMGAENSFLATFSSEHLSGPASTQQLDGFVALADESTARGALKIRVGTGRFRAGIATDSLPEPERSVVQSALGGAGVCLSDSVSVVPLRLGDHTLGVIYVDRRPGYERDRNLLEIFASQAAAAIQSALLFGQNALLFDLATKDPTTGVFLRGYAMQQFHQHLKRGHRSGGPVSVLMIDVDRFKEINDQHGHIAGDRALRQIGDLLRKCVRETDCVGRFGGDEFLIILPDTPPEGALVVAQRVMNGIGSVHLKMTEGDVPLHLSIGCGTLVGSEEGLNFNLLRTENVERVAAELIACADGSLYATKHSGEVGEPRITSWNEIQYSAAA